MVGVETVLVPVLLLERELCHRHGRNRYVEAQMTMDSEFVLLRACKHNQRIISSEKLSGSYGVIKSQRAHASFRPAIAPSCGNARL